MFKKLLIVGFLLLMLLLGSALIPTNVAHADSCHGACGQDPVQAGCTSSQYILARDDFYSSNGSEWEIRLRGTHSQSSACNNKIWASLVLLQGSDGISPSTDIRVDSSNAETFEFDLLRSNTFYSGAYTNMIDNIGNPCAYYVSPQFPHFSPNTCSAEPINR